MPLEGVTTVMKHMNWIAAGAVAAMLAAAPALRAQDATPPAAGADSIPTIAPVAPIDYSVLRNQSFTYLDLTQAKASGLSDDEVATAAKIAEETGQSFGAVREDLMNGATFTQLATKYNLSLADLYSVDDEKTKIDNYKQAYETTGSFAMKAMMNGGSGTSGSM